MKNSVVTGGEMAKKKVKGSLVYEILIVILTVVLVATLLYPKSVWKRVNYEAMLCRDQMERIVDAEGLYISFHESHTFDSSLVNVMNYIRNDSIFGLDSVHSTMRDTFYVKLIFDYLRDYQDIPTKKADDSAASLLEKRSDSLATAQVDSIINVMLNKILTCPTSRDTYKVQVVDTSAIKILKVSCPLDSVTLDSLNHNFWFRVVGSGKFENHGTIDNGQPSWEPMKRK